VIPTETHVNRAMRTVSELPFIPGCPIQVDMVTVVFPAGNVPGRLLIPRYSASWAARSGSRPGGQSRPTADYLGSLGALARGCDVRRSEGRNLCQQASLRLEDEAIPPYQHQANSSGRRMTTASVMGYNPERRINWPAERCRRRTRSSPVGGLCDGRVNVGMGRSEKREMSR